MIQSKNHHHRFVFHVFLKNLFKNPLLILFLCLSPLMGGMQGFLSHLQNAWIQKEWFATVINLFSAVLPAFPAYFIGLMMSLMSLDERDEGMWNVFQVTPIQPHTLVKERCIHSFFLASLAFLTMFLTSGPSWVPPWPSLLLGTLFSGMQSMMYLLALLHVAQDSVKGLVWGKLIGLFLLLPLFNRVLTTPIKIGLFLFPTAWMERLTQGPTPSPNILGIALLIHILWLSILVFPMFSAKTKKFGPQCP
ncbi:MAG: hypothetical protein MI717_07420 [Spirochaetales bacterium]|nr:hypothetical protein [Spirochaetales bacterium]